MIPSLVALYRNWLSILTPELTEPSPLSVRDSSERKPRDQHRAQIQQAEQLAAAICDTALVWQFDSAKHLREDSAFRTLAGYLEIEDNHVLPHISSLVFANLARTDWLATIMVRDFALEATVVQQISIYYEKLLKNDPSPGYIKSKEMLHSAGGLLKNLAVPEANAGPLLESGAIEAATRLCRMYDTRREEGHSWNKNLDDIFLKGLGILRQLARNSAEACRVLVEGGSFTRGPQAASPLATIDSTISLRDLALWLATKDTSSINKQARTEIARIIVVLYRTLNKSSKSHDRDHTNESLLSKLSTRLIFANTLAYLVVKPGGTSFAGEGWFGLSLMAKASVVGASNVYQALRMDCWDVVERIILETPEGTKGRERENAKYLANELLRKLDGGQINKAHRQLLEGFVRSRREVVLATPISGQP
jgi:hypothetical protein